MKKISKTLLWVTLPLFLLSCKGQRPERLIYRYLDSDDPITLWGREVTLSYDESWKDKVDTLYEEINTIVKEGTASSNTLHKKVNELYSMRRKYSQASSEADLYSSMNCTNEDYALENKIRTEYSSATYKMSDVEKTIVKSSKYRDAYLRTYRPSLQGEALQKFIQECENPSKPETVEAVNTMSTLKTKFRSGQLTSYEFYHEFVPVANAYAVDNGFDNYLEYVYKKNYGRDYTVSDISSFAENTAEKLVTAEQYLKNKCSLYSENTEATEMEEDIKYGFLGKYLRDFEQYAYYIGGQFFNNYNYLLDQGNYFFSAVPDSPYTAYSTGSVSLGSYLFFSLKYQDIVTFVHEFGHYNAGFESDASSYDIFETQSQGDELLFMYYLCNLSDMYQNEEHNDFLDYHKYSTLSDFIGTVKSATWVNDCEEYIFTHDGITEEEMLAMVNEKAAKYGMYSQYEDFNRTYVGYVGPENTGYYISYAISAMASLSLYALAEDEGFDEAAESYRDIYSIGSVSFSEMIKQARLYDPLTDQGYQAIANALVK